MTTIHEPAVDQTSRIAATDAIRNAVDDFGLPFPATIQFSPGADGPLAIFVDTDEERDAWRQAFHGGWVFAGRPAAVLSTQASRERICSHCGGDFTHRLGCPSEPVITGTPAEVAAQLGQHFGARANHDEAVRLSTVVVHLVRRGGEFACGESSGAFSSYTTEVTCPGCKPAALPQRTPGAALAATNPTCLDCPTEHTYADGCRHQGSLSFDGAALAVHFATGTPVATLCAGVEAYAAWCTTDRQNVTCPDCSRALLASVLVEEAAE